MRLLLSLSVVLLACTHLPSVTAQDETLVTPQPEHKMLERLVGEWKYEKLSIPAEGAEPDNLGTGTVSAEMIGGFFVVSRWSGTLYGMDYQAAQVLGFDTTKKKYSGTWIDSYMSHRWELGGDVDDETEELILETNGPGPAGGTMTFRERTQFHSPDSITIIGEMKRGEEWVSFSATKLTRTTTSSVPKPESEKRPMYGIIGKLVATEGNREKMIEILLNGTRNMPGCKLYVISEDRNDETGIWITEIWDSEESHQASLQLPQVQQAIAEGRTMIESFGERHIVTPVGGFGTK